MLNCYIFPELADIMYIFHCLVFFVIYYILLVCVSTLYSTYPPLLIIQWIKKNNLIIVHVCLLFVI